MIGSPGIQTISVMTWVTEMTITLSMSGSFEISDICIMFDFEMAREMPAMSIVLCMSGMSYSPTTPEGPTISNISGRSKTTTMKISSTVTQNCLLY